MTQIISITSHKGGTGKTISTLNLGAALQRMGRKTLLIDLDAQCNLTTALGLDPKAERTVGKFILGDYTAKEVIRQFTDGLSIIPAAYTLISSEKQLATEIGQESFLKRALEPLRKDFDFILIDCPPSLGTLTTNALVAADRYIVPMSAETFSYDSLSHLMSATAIVKDRVNPRLQLLGVLFTRHSFNSRTMIGQTLEKAVRAKYPTFQTTIRNNVALIESVFKRQHVYAYDPDSPGAEDYMTLANEIITLTTTTNGKQKK